MKNYLFNKFRSLKHLTFFLGGIAFGSGSLLISIIALAVGFALDLALSLAVSKTEIKTGQSNDLLRRSGEW